MSKVTDHYGRRFKLGDKPYHPTVAHNNRAWNLIQPLLDRYGSVGVDYELLGDAIPNHPTSSGQSFIRYCIDRGWLKPA